MKHTTQFNLVMEGDAALFRTVSIFKPHGVVKDSVTGERLRVNGVIFNISGSVAYSVVALSTEDETALGESYSTTSTLLEGLDEPFDVRVPIGVLKKVVVMVILDPNGCFRVNLLSQDVNPKGGHKDARSFNLIDLEWTGMKKHSADELKAVYEKRRENSPCSRVALPSMSTA